MSTTIGNPNLFIWSNWQVASNRNTTRQWNTYDRPGITDPPLGLDGARVFIMNDLTQMKTATLKQNNIDFQVPTITVNFKVNGVSYFDHVHTNNDLTIFRFDLTTLVGNFGAPPLILNKGDTWAWSITDGNRLNASDIVGFRVTVWADVIGYPLP